MKNHNLGLDGARAMAISMVIASHYLGIIHPGTTEGIAAFLGGGGVQLFFALSGFLIGSILLEVAEKPSVGAWWRFMLRRWGRTLPCYFVVLAVLIIVSPDKGFSDFLMYATMTQNLLGNPSHPAFFAVSWSLAVEEIFYISFATILLFCIRLIGKKAIWLCLVLFILAPFAARFYIAIEHLPMPYHAALFCLDGIAWGVFLAVLKSRKSILFNYPLLCGMAGACLLWNAWQSYLLGPVAVIYPWTPSLAGAGWMLILVPIMKITSLCYFDNAIKHIARLSFCLYLLHETILSAVKDIPYASLIFITVLMFITIILHSTVEILFMKMRPKQNIESNNSFILMGE